MPITSNENNISSAYLNGVEIPKAMLNGVSLFNNSISELYNGNDAAANPNDTETNSVGSWEEVGDVSVISESVDAYAGTYHLTIESTGSGTTSDRAEWAFIAEDGEDYEISIWAKEAVGSDARLQFFEGLDWSSSLLTNTWTEYKQTVTASSTLVKLRVYPQTGSGSSGDKVYIDNISIKKV